MECETRTAGMECESASTDASAPRSDAKAECYLSSLDVFGSLTVSDAAGPGGLNWTLLHADATIQQAARALATSGQSACGVGDVSGGLVGLFTENDVVRAYFEGILPGMSVQTWLHGGMARAPDLLLDKLRVRPSDRLAEVAERMVANALDGDCACHHVVVQDDDGRYCGVLSSLDMVRAFNSPVVKDLNRHIAADLEVRAAMKPRDETFTCPPDSSIKDVLKVLLMSQQNSVVIADDEGIHGFATPHNMVRAFADGVRSSCSIGQWLRGLPSGAGNRVVASDVRLIDAAATMAARGVNHLVVVVPGSAVVIGSLSSLDLLLQTSGLAPPTPHTVSLAAGPTVGSLLEQPWHLAAGCGPGATLGFAAELLASSGRTAASMTMQRPGEEPTQGLLTESHLMRAYAKGWPRDSSLEDFLLHQDSQWPRLPMHLVVRPSVLLTEAATLMLSAGEHLGGPCRHLVVQNEQGEWLGIFSALDVSRALSGCCSELDVAKTGADQTAVDMIMKRHVPTCWTSDTLGQALMTLVQFAQNCAMVYDLEGVFQGVITSRCAVQALAQGVPHDCTVAAWLRSRLGQGEPREVAPGARLLEAAALMASRGLHHLIVTERLGAKPMGVLSALDLVRGVASMNCHVPFVSLRWLRQVKGRACCSLWEV
mmetsp:Transcript_45489/g.131720  ORF Transcript_45489/g.131720 Transcript_45489/m.131720 type:complete len:654 (+) Transcript_45489:64-2025(+)